MLDDGRVQCDLCPRACKLREGARGLCFVRARQNDAIVLTTYGRSAGFCIDPIEKKPLNHFLPGTSVLSFGTAGCNLACNFCQNHDISKSREMDRMGAVAGPETIAVAAAKLGCASIAFTYNDPIIFHEYARDIAAACHERGVKTVAVTAGYLTDALVEGMRIVGVDFRDGILFVPEVLMAANAMKSGMALLRPLLVETGAPPTGKMVIGTVKGDIHDIGKNLVAMMMEGAGFEVVDLGINTSVESYLEALDTHQPDILGMSALLTTTMPYMKVVIDSLVQRGIREDYIVLVGGAPLNEAFAESIGADAYCRDAAVAVETASQLVAARRRPNVEGAA